MIKRLEVTNFRAIRGTRTYDLEPGVTALVGRNEAGKTSSLLALAYACYGAQAMPEGIDSDDLINDLAKELSVTLDFTHNGDDYVLTRSQNRSGRGDASLTRNGQPLASGRAPVTQAITQLFGVDHVGFMVSVFARQDELDALAGKKGAERITTMLRLLGVEHVAGAVKAIRKDVNEEKRRLEVLRAQVGNLDELLARKESEQRARDDLTVQYGAAKEAEDDLATTITDLQMKMAALEPKRDAYLAWQREHDAAQVAVSTAKVRLADAEKRITVVPKAPKHVEGDLDVAEAEYQSLREKWAALDESLRLARKECDGLTDTCAACKRPFDNAEQVAEHRASLEERIAFFTKERDLIAHEGREAEKKRDALAAYIGIIKDQKQAIIANRAAQDEAESLRTQLEAAQAALDALVAPEDPTAAIATVQTALDEKSKAHTAAQVRLATVTESIRGIERSLASLEADLARAGEKADEITAVEKRVVTLDVAAREMAAMKERLIGSVIPTLEARASSIVADLTDGKHTELRLTSDYEIQYVTETGQLRSFANLSGGAKTAFALALRLAIAELRAGSVSFLCLDEVFASVDDERQGLAWEAIERLTKRYSQVLLITHTQGLRDRATNVIAL